MFPQLPITLFLGYFQEIVFPVDYIMGSFMLVFLVWAVLVTEITVSVFHFLFANSFCHSLCLGGAVFHWLCYYSHVYSKPDCALFTIVRRGGV